MRILGICVDPAAGKPRILGVVLSGTVRSPALEEEFELRATDSDPSEQVVDLGRLLLGKLPGLTFDRAVVRIAGASPVARRNKAQFSRAHAEGVAIYVLREHCQHPVATGDPASISKAIGIKKDELTEIAKQISNQKREAVIAAIRLLPVS